MSSNSDEELSLQDVVMSWRTLLASGQLDAHDRAACLLNLSNALSELAEQEGDPPLASEAIEVGNEALRSVDPITQNEFYLVISSDLSSSYLTRFELAGDRNDLNHALASIRTATEGTKEGSDRRCARLANYCNTLSTAFQAYGNRENIDDAISIGQTASEDNYADANDRARALSNLGRAFELRYDAFYVFSDVLKAVEVVERAISLADDPSIIAICQSNLVAHLIDVAERDCKDETVEQAITHGEAVYDELYGRDRARCAHNLSYLFRLRFEREDEARNLQAGDPQDLQTAVDYATDAINSYPGEDVELAMYEDELVLCLELAYDRSSSDADKLSLAISLAEKAVSRTAEQDPRRANYTNHLVGVLRKRREAGDLERAITLSEAVLNSESAGLIPRIGAGQACGTLYQELRDVSRAFTAFENAVDLIQKTARNALQRSDQQYVLGQCMGLSSTAASLALEAGRTPAQAFNILEKGRAVLTELAILGRDGIPSKAAACTGIQPLLERCKHLKLKLGDPAMRSASLDSNHRVSASAELTIRGQLQSELAELETRIQRITPDELRPSIPESEPPSMIGMDFAVAFNVTAVRSDAFIVTDRGVQVLGLPSLKVEDLAKHVRALLGQHRVTRISLETWKSSNQVLTEMLAWLWDCAVGPVLSHLGLLDQTESVGRLPRVCWIASGVMGLMPMHAAGDHTGASKSFTLAHVMSSYAVSLRALNWCRRELAPLVGEARPWGSEEVAIITMSATPGRAGLDFKDEVAAILHAFPKAREIPRPTASLACESIFGSEIVHFACHAESDPEDPSNSSLLLLKDDGTTIDRLSVYTLSGNYSPRARLAFLSACQTADQQKLDHVDETIHLAGAFQIAGFPQIVGSLWEAENEYASGLAIAFYQKFAHAGQDSLGIDSAAFAMHHAVMSIRSEDPEAVLSWAPFVVYGA